jgi:hypothetical protein
MYSQITPETSYIIRCTDGTIHGGCQKCVTIPLKPTPDMRLGYSVGICNTHRDCGYVIPAKDTLWKYMKQISEEYYYIWPWLDGIITVTCDSYPDVRRTVMELKNVRYGLKFQKLLEFYKKNKKNVISCDKPIRIYTWMPTTFHVYGEFLWLRATVENTRVILELDMWIPIEAETHVLRVRYNPGEIEYTWKIHPEQKQEDAQFIVELPNISSIVAIDIVISLDLD